MRLNDVITGAPLGLKWLAAVSQAGVLGLIAASGGFYRSGGWVHARFSLFDL